MLRVGGDTMANASGDWGHNDWNGNGTYDSYDNMMDYEFEQEYYKNSGSNYGESRKKSGNGSWVVIVIALILGLFNETLGAIIMFFYLWYSIFIA